MDSRFTFKDFVFAVLFILVIGAVIWCGYQFSYQESRLNDVKNQIAQLDQTQKQQMAVLSDLRTLFRKGISISGTQAGTERIRQKNPDGSQYVFYPDIPSSPRDPSKLADYAFGDWIINNIGGEPKNITPLIAGDMQGQISQVPVLESLVTLNPETQEYEPYLADKFWISADGLKFKFHIRPEACFSNGTKMTADDVLFTFNTIMNPEVDCEPLRGYYKSVGGCTKIDNETVEFTMKEPYFLAMDFIGGLYIIPQEVYKFNKGEDYNKRTDLLIGTGPYKLDKWEKGQKITFVRNENYWGERPTLDRLIFLFIGNPKSQLETFLKGDLDEIYEPIAPDPEDYVKYSQDPEFLKKFTAYKFSRANAMYMYIGYNERKPMFKDKETRRALTMLIDRKGIIDEFLLGFGTEMNGPFNIQKKQNDPTLKPLPYDPGAAKKLLAEAGWKPGTDGVLQRDGVRFEFNLALRTGVPVRERIATRVQQWLKGAGIKMNLTPYEASVLFEHVDDRSYDAVLAGWGGAGVEEDPNQIWHSKSMENKGSNHVGFNNPEADRLIEEARRTLDEAKRMELWHKFEHVVYEEQPYTWLYSEEDCAFINGRFKNTKPYPTGLNFYDWYVPLGSQKYK